MYDAHETLLKTWYRYAHTDLSPPPCFYYGNPGGSQQTERLITWDTAN